MIKLQNTQKSHSTIHFQSTQSIPCNVYNSKIWRRSCITVNKNIFRVEISLWFSIFPVQLVNSPKSSGYPRRYLMSSAYCPPFHKLYSQQSSVASPISHQKNYNHINSIQLLTAVRTKGFLTKLLIGLLHQGPPTCESASIVLNVKFRKIHSCFVFLSHAVSLNS